MLRYGGVSPEYFLEIEAHFAQRRGTPFVLSAKDWTLMQKWAADGVPLPVVLEAIDSCFDKANERQKKINGLSYCRHAVKELWQERRELQVGAEEATPEEGAEPLLASLAEAFESSPNDAVRAFAPRIRELAREKTVPRIEERLMDLEGELVSLLASDDLRAEASRAGGGNERAAEAHLRRLVRETFALRRLTLFR